MLQTTHQKQAAQQSLILNIAVIITSDTRTEKTDKTGNVINSILQNAGHKCVLRKIVRNNLTLIRAEVKKALKAADIVITSGGTGCGRIGRPAARRRASSSATPAGFSGSGPAARTAGSRNEEASTRI